jgi:hypothetical protein
MASTIFHHWFDRVRAQPPARRRWLAGGAIGLVLAAVFVLGVMAGRGLGLPNGPVARAKALSAANAALQARVQGLEQQRRTSSTALDALRASMSARDAELQTLKREQALYSRLIGADGAHSGLGVHGLAVSAVKGTDAWNFVATLVNTAENADVARGTLTLAVEGVSAGKLATLKWQTLAGARAGDGLPFAFKFFQQVTGALVLPAGFVPNRVVVTLTPRNGPAVSRSLSWQAAVGPSAS